MSKDTNETASCVIKPQKT